MRRATCCRLSGPVRDTPPYRAIPFRDSIAEGGIAPVCLLLVGYRASIDTKNPIARNRGVSLIWIQKGFTAEPPRNDSGANFQRNDSDSAPKVRVTGRKSELQTKSRRYSPKSEPNRPEKGPEWGFRCFYRKPPLKPS